VAAPATRVPTRTPAREPRASRTPRIVVRFAVYAGIAFVVAVGVGLWVSRADSVGRARDDVASDAEFLANRLGRDDLARTAFLWPRGARAASDTAQLDQFLDPQDAARDAVRVTLVSPDAIVTYSTDHRLTGKDLGRVPTGTRVTNVGDKKVMESYAPVYWALDPGRPRGYLGLDRDYGPVSTQIRNSFLVQAGTIAAALLLLYLALLPIMHRLTARLQRALVERKRLAVIVETSNDAIIGRDRDGLITSWNAGAEAIYGWSEDEVLGRPIDFLLSEPLEVGDELELTRMLHSRKDGRYVRVSMTVSPIRDENGDLVGSSLIARDVTEVVELEQELRHAQKQEAVARFAKAVANELDELVAGLVPTDQGARGLELVRRLQDFGREEEMHPEYLDLNKLLLGLRFRLELQLGHDVDLLVDPAAEHPSVHIDPERLGRMVLDLALSAREAMPNGGRLVIRTADVDFTRRGSTRDSALEAGHYVCLSVSDSGRTQHADRMGLGLAAVFGLVEQSGGTIGIESTPESGTTVRVHLPRVEQPAGDRVPASGVGAGV
jgi:PAS domain S-box-containing protein